VGENKKVLVEFVSANPTGPLSIGHGRQAVLGDAIARLLEATGHDVTREYYYNDAGRQMRILGQSTRARYMEVLGLDGDFPEDGYQGEYIYDIARKLVAEKGDSLKDTEDVNLSGKRPNRRYLQILLTPLHASILNLIPITTNTPFTKKDSLMT